MADFNYKWYLDGTVQVIVPTVTEGATTGNWRAYKFSLTMPATVGTFQGLVTSVGGLEPVMGGQITIDLQAYTLTSLAALLLTSQGIPGVRSTDASDLGQVKSGDAWKSDTLTIPLGKISPWGLSDSTGYTISAEARTAPGTPASSVALTCAVASAGSLDFTISWDAMPSGMLLTTETSVTWYIDVQLKETALPNKIITTNSYFIAVTWDANDTP